MTQILGMLNLSFFILLFDKTLMHFFMSLKEINFIYFCSNTEKVLLKTTKHIYGVSFKIRCRFIKGGLAKRYHLFVIHPFVFDLFYWFFLNRKKYFASYTYKKPKDNTKN